MTQKIYFAHHQYKYGTQVERYELDLIANSFPSATIFNPSTDIDQNIGSEAAIMDICLTAVRNSDILVFSSLSGVVGKGVYDEVKEAFKYKKKVYFLFGNSVKRVRLVFFIKTKSGSNRTFAKVRRLPF